MAVYNCKSFWLVKMYVSRTFHSWKEACILIRRHTLLLLVNFTCCPYQMDIYDPIYL